MPCFDWRRLETVLNHLLTHDASFSLDKIILSATNPIDSPSYSKSPFSKRRNVFDIRYLRLDNYFSPNGREIYVPHTVPRKVYVPQNFSLQVDCQAGRAEMIFDIPEDEEEENDNKKKVPAKSKKALVNCPVSLKRPGLLVAYVAGIFKPFPSPPRIRYSSLSNRNQPYISIAMEDNHGRA